MRCLAVYQIEGAALQRWALRRARHVLLPCTIWSLRAERHGVQLSAWLPVSSHLTDTREWCVPCQQSMNSGMRERRHCRPAAHLGTASGRPAGMLLQGQAAEPACFAVSWSFGGRPRVSCCW